ncbi:hypothetical protein Tco_0519838 [Tanacetum coccineum]
MMPNSEKLIEIFIGGLPRSIEGNVTTSKPQTLEEAITITQRLMNQVTKHNSVQGTNDHKQKFDDRRTFNNNNNYQNNRNNNNSNRNNDHQQQQNRRQETVRAYAVTLTENNRLPGHELRKQRASHWKQLATSVRAAPVDRASYRLAPLEMQELSDQLQELVDRSFIRPNDDIPPPPLPPPQTQTPTQQYPHIVSTIKLPILKKGEYDIWAMKMEHYLAHTDYPIWEVIQRGNGPVLSVSCYQASCTAEVFDSTEIISIELFNELRAILHSRSFVVVTVSDT